MRRNLFAIFTIAAVLSGVLAPIQSFAGPTATPGKSQGNGPCVTSGNSNSKVQSTKNVLKPCTFNITFDGYGVAAVVDPTSLLSIPYGTSRTIYFYSLIPEYCQPWFGLDENSNGLVLQTNPYRYTYTNVTSDHRFEMQSWCG